MLPCPMLSADMRLASMLDCLATSEYPIMMAKPAIVTMNVIILIQDLKLVMVYEFPWEEIVWEAATLGTFGEVPAGGGAVAGAGTVVESGVTVSGALVVDDADGGRLAVAWCDVAGIGACWFEPEVDAVWMLCIANMSCTR